MIVATQKLLEELEHHRQGLEREIERLRLEAERVTGFLKSMRNGTQEPKAKPVVRRHKRRKRRNFIWQPGMPTYEWCAKQIGDGEMDIHELVRRATDPRYKPEHWPNRIKPLDARQRIHASMRYGVQKGLAETRIVDVVGARGGKGRAWKLTGKQPATEYKAKTGPNQGLTVRQIKSLGRLGKVTARQ